MDCLNGITLNEQCPFDNYYQLCHAAVCLLHSVREKGNGTFALSISHHNVTKHYRIDKRKTSVVEKLAIEDGPQFENLMDVSACRVLFLSM